MVSHQAIQITSRRPLLRYRRTQSKVLFVSSSQFQAGPVIQSLCSPSLSQGAREDDEQVMEVTSANPTVWLFSFRGQLHQQCCEKWTLVNDETQAKMARMAAAAAWGLGESSLAGTLVKVGRGRLRARICKKGRHCDSG